MKTVCCMHPTVSLSIGLGLDQEFAFLRKFQVILKLLIWELHFENYCPISVKNAF